MARIRKKLTVEYWLFKVYVDRKKQPCPADTPGARYVERLRVNKHTPGAVKVTVPSKKYYGRLPGTKTDIPLATVKSVAEKMFAKEREKAERRRAGIADPFEEPRGKPLTEHLDDYIRDLEAAGRCPEYVAKTRARVTAVLTACGFRFIDDVRPEKVNGYLHRLRQPRPVPPLPPGQEWFTPRELEAALGGERPTRLGLVLEREGLAADGNGKARRYPRATVEALRALCPRGISPATSNGYLTDIKGFVKWLFETERTDRNRLVSLGRLNVDVDRRHERRALEQDELVRFLEAAAASATVFRGLSGPDRRLLYETVLSTGFRASEAARLTGGSFDLDAPVPAARVGAAGTKNRREAEQPLHAALAGAVRDFLADRPDAQQLWGGNWNKHAAEMVRLDLKAAGIPYRDADGRVVDFHALRHTFITFLQAAGVHPKMAQDLARHSDIRLTMNVYTHTRLHDRAEAVERLGGLLGAAKAAAPNAPNAPNVPKPSAAPSSGAATG